MVKPASFLPRSLSPFFPPHSFKTSIFTFHILGLWSVLCGAHHHASRFTQPGAKIIIINQSAIQDVATHWHPATVFFFFFFQLYITNKVLQASKGKGGIVCFDGALCSLCKWTWAYRWQSSRAFGFGWNSKTDSLSLLFVLTRYACMPVFAIFLSSHSPLWSLRFPTLVISSSSTLLPACLISLKRFKASPRDWLISSLWGYKKWDIDVTQAFSVTVEEWKQHSLH